MFTFEGIFKLLFQQRIVWKMCNNRTWNQVVYLKRWCIWNSLFINWQLLIFELFRLGFTEIIEFWQVSILKYFRFIFNQIVSARTWAGCLYLLFIYFFQIFFNFCLYLCCFRSFLWFFIDIRDYDGYELVIFLMISRQSVC